MKEDSFRVGGTWLQCSAQGLCAIDLAGICEDDQAGGIRWRGVSTRTFSYSGLKLAGMSHIDTQKCVVRLRLREGRISAAFASAPAHPFSSLLTRASSSSHIISTNNI